MFKGLLGEVLKLTTQKLATLLDKLRISQPIIYLILAGLVIGGTEVLRANPDIIANFGKWFEYVIIVFEGLIITVTSSRTKRHIPSERAKVKVMVAEGVELYDYDD